MNIYNFSVKDPKGNDVSLDIYKGKVLLVVNTATGLMCIPFYIISFAQMALPIDAKLKGALWIIFFGLAKTTQYGGLTILGAEGLKRLRTYRKRKKDTH